MQKSALAYKKYLQYANCYNTIISSQIFGKKKPVTRVCEFFCGLDNQKTGRQTSFDLSIKFFQ
jgi:hypothetical protein